MLQWIANWASRHTPTPEKHAERALNELRMALFQAEQRVLDAQMHAAYYRSRITFCEEVLKSGIEKVSDLRNDQVEAARTAPPSLKVASAQRS
ncbi:hypothetical protein [Paraburkholderia caballeronis]|uniref:Uncharacterized protein n=1 Tax=Paraburkholderia caballeronis TaxID=416943 RepID=A0A1H7LFI2_9BURK|nr:hypothetical protein [Paraburkholderia caballeronis]PXW28426.1 hypothetical protein C7403_102320 [Paraburkholderia caballeronis]PXX03792.1 hypothetical protein C7407_102320 [Paraburkholderia caballeronis]RAK04536.1 hypothetical protein C7409_102320 [Paraburkholderia caballeronis]TDV19441.1 hypothetical protein C7408_102186 [Paraburkholderia caballeronis]TDV22041.1 hypothetical protein C7406_101186 [Paraburkholderia caballeronis]